MKNEELLDLLKAAGLEIQRLKRQVGDAKKRGAREPIAVIGAACRFPGAANSPQALWEALARGSDAVTSTMPRWSRTWPDYLGKLSPAAHWGGLVDDIEGFDAAFFGVAPREAIKMDPQQRMLLEVAWEALERAGYTQEQLLESATGVYVGEMTHDYEARVCADESQRDVYALTGSFHCFTSGRLSYLLGLQGPSITLDTACSSSLVAVHLACQTLYQEEVSLALACGVNVLVSPSVMEMTAGTQALSPDGRCRTFDAKANGYVRGEGCGVLVLKRLSDAKRDGDRILMLIRGSAVNQDGPSSALTVPNGRAQVALLRAALKDANIEPEAISYVEAHGTGTPLGDPIEMDAIREIFGKRARDAALYVGSVKTNMGHLEAAAGMAGLIKVLLALEHGEIPRHLHFEALNPMIDLRGAPLVVPKQAVPWVRGERPRLAGVSGFALSGTNAHVVVEEAPAIAVVAPEEGEPRSQILPLSAHTQESLSALARRYITYLEEPRTGGVAAADIAYGAGVRRTHRLHRMAVVGSNKQRWVDGLKARLQEGGSPQPSISGTELIFVFPGQGSQWLGMGRELFLTEPVFRRSLEACDAGIGRTVTWSLIDKLIHTTDAHIWERVDTVQPLLFAMQVCLANLWQAWGIRPTAVLGHSMGEVAAAHVAGALTLDDAARVICVRSARVQDARGGGAMLAVLLEPDEVRSLLEPYEGRMWVAAKNGGASHILAGDVDAASELEAALAQRQVFCRRIRVDYASHTPLMEPLLEGIRRELSGLAPSEARLPMCSTVSSDWMKQGFDATYWAQNIRQPVLFGAAMERVWDHGYRRYLEVSPHPVLMGDRDIVVRPLPPKVGHASAQVASSLRRDRPERETLLQTLGQLYEGGMTPNFRTQHESPRPLPDLPVLCWQHQPYWVPPAPGHGRPQLRRGAHPLLGQVFEGQKGDKFWEMVIDLQGFPALSHHKVGDAVVFPGAAYLEMMLACSKQSGVADPQVVSLREVEFREMLILSPEGGVRLQTLLEPGHEGEWRVRIASNAGRGWTVHATAVVERPERPPQEALRYTPEVPTTAFSRSKFYGMFAGFGQVWTGPFQGVEAAWMEGAGDAWVRLRPNDPSDGYLLEPAFLDSALHAGVLQAWNAHGRLPRSTPWVPTRIERAVWRADRSGIVFSHASSAEQPKPGAWTGSIHLLSAEGAVVLDLRGVQAVQVPADDRSLEDDELFFARVWEPLGDAPVSAASLTGQTWLILGGDEVGVSARLGTLLSERGAQVDYVLPGGDPQNAISGAVRDQSYTVAVHMWSLNTGGAGADEKPTGGDVALQGALWLVQRLAERGSVDPARLFLVTNGAHHVAPGDGSPAVFQAPLWGFARSVPYEHPELHCKRIDLRYGQHDDVDAVARSLLTELLSPSSEDELALRAGARRFGARIVRRVPAMNGASAALRSPRRDGSYLVTGGLGGLGLSIGRWLAQEGAGRIVLVGRSGVTQTHQARAIEVMRSSGAEVVVARANVADRDEVASLVAQFERSPMPLRGVLHAAGVADNRFIADTDGAQVAAVLAPKVQGAWNLHALTQPLELDFFILYASAAGLFGSPRMATYAAGNTFLDSLAELRQVKGLCGLSIDWGAFSDAGLAAGADNQGVGMGQRGMNAISTDKGLRLLKRLLGTSQAQVGVVSFNADKWLEFHPRVAAGGLMSRLKRGDPQAPGDVLTRLHAQSGDAREAMLTDFVWKQLVKVLRLEGHEAPQLDKTFKAFGLDSLMGLELRNRLDAALQLRSQNRSLPVSAVVNPNATPRQVISLLCDILGTNEARVTFDAVHGAGARTLKAVDITLGRLLGSLPQRPSGAVEGRPEHVLLTGANGFLGRFLLLALLKPSAGRRRLVTCIVRASSDAEARQRVLASYGEGTAQRAVYEEHVSGGAVKVYAGDLTKPGFGLAPSRLEDLSIAVDSVLHNGALVNHAFSYAQLFEPNVLGTVEAIRFALRGRPKRVQFVSTLAVAECLGRRTAVFESEDAAAICSERSGDGQYGAGYGASKWVGELLMRELFDRYGVPVKVFRCGVMMPAAREDGHVNAIDFLTRLFFSVITTGVAPASFYEGGKAQSVRFDGLPVDYAADAIACLATADDGGYLTYHVSAPRTREAPSLDDMVDWVRDAGYPIVRIDSYHLWYQEFSRRLSELGSDVRGRSSMPAIEQWSQPLTGSGCLDPARFSSRVMELGLEAPPVITRDYIRHYVRQMIELNLLAKPARGKR